MSTEQCPGAKPKHAGEPPANRRTRRKETKPRASIVKFDPFPYLDDMFKDHIEDFDNSDELELQVARFRVIVANAVACEQCPLEVMKYVRSYPDVFAARLCMYLVAKDKLPRIIVGNKILVSLNEFEVCLREQTEKKRKRLGGYELREYVAKLKIEERRKCE